MRPDDTPVHVPFTALPDLAAQLVGGAVRACSDDFFAEAANLLRAEPPVFDPERFTERGKWMDGWESRRARHRDEPADFAVVELGMPGTIHGVDVNTAHFLGNAPRSVDLHACELEPGADPAASDVRWERLVGRTQVAPGTRNLLPVDPAARGRRFTHVRLTIHPDGGVARLRVHGTGMPAAGSLDGEVDLAAAANGGHAVAASDQFFGGISNLVLPGESGRMDEGWETRRTRDRLDDDWVVVRLARPGRVRRVTVDTSHFRGNAPESCRLDGCLLGERASETDLGDPQLPWRELVPEAPLRPDSAHELDSVGADVVDHVRLVIRPDGGVARLRVWGSAEAAT